MQNRIEGLHYVGDVCHPENLEEVIKIIDHARKNNLQVRVIGSALLIRSAIYDANNKQQIKVVLSGELRDILDFTESEDKSSATVKVGAGCNFSVNPNDKNSTEANSFNFQINKLGYALPGVGGTGVATIGGFIQTGSTPSSAKHSLDEYIESIEWVNGKGEICVAHKDTALFNAVLVSMGLFGIITAVTFKLPPTFLVAGQCNYELKKFLFIA